MTAIPSCGPAGRAPAVIHSQKVRLVAAFDDPDACRADFKLAHPSLLHFSALGRAEPFHQHRVAVGMPDATMAAFSGTRHRVGMVADAFMGVFFVRAGMMTRHFRGHEAEYQPGFIAPVPKGE